MADFMGQPKSLSWSGSPPTSPLSNIVSMSYESDKRIDEFYSGDNQVATHWQSSFSATLTVSTTDIAAALEFESSLGCPLTNVVAAWKGAVDSCGSSNGDDITRTFGRMIISKVSGIGGEVPKNTPCVATITLLLSRAPDDVDPVVS